MLYLEMLGQGIHEPEHHLHLFLTVETGLGMEAIVATAAVVLLICLSEIVEQQLPAALARLRVRSHFAQQLTAYLLLRHRLALHKLLELLDVLVAVVGYTGTLLTVPSGAARLLEIALDALRDVVMDDEAHIGLVYAHSEGYGGHDNVHLLHQEAVLVLGPRLGVQPGVIRQSLD